MDGSHDYLPEQNEPGGSYAFVFTSTETSADCVQTLVANVTLLPMTGFQCQDPQANNYLGFAAGRQQEFPWWIFIIVGVVLAIVIGVGLYFWQQQKKKAQEAEELIKKEDEERKMNEQVTDLEMTESSLDFSDSNPMQPDAPPAPVESGISQDQYDDLQSRLDDALAEINRLTKEKEVDEMDKPSHRRGRRHGGHARSGFDAVEDDDPTF